LSRLCTLPGLLPRLPSQLILSTPRQRLDLIAEPLDVIQRSSLVASLPLFLPRLTWA
jgi:hypothetical protein